MTSEVAVMNKLAVALAADSAATIGGTKVYNNANKLFALSKHHPVGVMVFQMSEHMGVPWESLIKMFRTKLGRDSFAHLEDYLTALVTFLESGTPRLFSDQDESDHLNFWAKKALEDLQSTIEQQVTERSGQQALQDLAVVAGEARDVVLHIATAIVKQAFLSGFDEAMEKGVEALIDIKTPEALEARLGGISLPDEARRAVLRICASYTCREIRSSAFSGIVVAGFGDQDIFPKIVEMRVYGSAMKKLRCSKSAVTSVSLSTDSIIHPFAQRHMADTFMRGVHPEASRLFTEALDSSLLDAYPNQLLAGIPDPFTDAQKAAFLANADNIGRATIQGLRDRLKKFENDQSREIIAAVCHLEKEDLASFAESLVQLTSMRQRVTLGQETVGGPVDVAVISKGDGFIWMRRKHYFSAALNPQFFSDHFGATHAPPITTEKRP